MQSVPETSRSLSFVLTDVVSSFPKQGHRVPRDRHEQEERAHRERSGTWVAESHPGPQSRVRRGGPVGSRLRLGGLEIRVPRSREKLY